MLAFSDKTSNSLIEINMMNGAMEREISFTGGSVDGTTIHRNGGKGIQDYFCFLGRIITVYFSSNGWKKEESQGG